MHQQATASPVSLDDVLAYRHPGVIRRYCKEHDTNSGSMHSLDRRE
jgi:hypothetical protein